MLHWHGRFPARSNSRLGYPAVKGRVKTVARGAPRTNREKRGTVS